MTPTTMTAPLRSARDLEADSRAVSRAVILEVLSRHPETPPRRRTIARRTLVLYEEARTRGLRPAAALAEAIETVLPYADQLGERGVCLGPLADSTLDRRSHNHERFPTHD